jgi:hypothetical protein
MGKNALLILCALACGCSDPGAKAGKPGPGTEEARIVSHNDLLADSLGRYRSERADPNRPDPLARLTEAVPKCDELVRILTGGGGLSGVGEAIGSRYGRAVGRGYDLSHTSSAPGLELLGNILRTEVLYFNGKAALLRSKIQEGLSAEPPEAMKVTAAVKEARELLRRLERDGDGDGLNDDGLFFLLGWMVEKLDPPDAPGWTAIRLVGGQEFNLLFFSAAGLWNALSDAAPSPYSGEGLQCLERAFCLEFDAWKILTTLDDPTQRAVRRQIGVLLNGTRDLMQTERWREVLRLMSALSQKRRTLAQGTSGDPMREKVVEMEWVPGETAQGLPCKSVTIECVTFKGFKIPMTFRIVDPDGIMAGKSYPTIKGFRLTRRGFTGDLYCHDTPAVWLRITVHECRILGPSGKVLKNFEPPSSPARDYYDVAAGEWIAPFEWTAETDIPEEDVSEDGKVVVTLGLSEAR